jgi:hypothetical protein
MVKELSVQEQKYLAVMAVLADGRAVSEVAAAWGAWRQSVHAWLRRYGEAGLPDLEPRSSRPADAAQCALGRPSGCGDRPSRRLRGTRCGQSC